MPYCNFLNTGMSYGYQGYNMGMSNITQPHCSPIFPQNNCCPPPMMGQSDSMSGMMNMMMQMFQMSMMAKMCGIDMDFGEMFKGMSDYSSSVSDCGCNNSKPSSQNSHVSRSNNDCGCNDGDGVVNFEDDVEVPKATDVDNDCGCKPIKTSNSFGSMTVPKKADKPVSPNFTTGDNEIDKQMQKYISDNADGAGQTLDLKKMEKKDKELYKKVLSSGINYDEARELTVKMDKKNANDYLNLNLGINSGDINLENADVNITTQNRILSVDGDKNSSVEGITGDNLTTLKLVGDGLNLDTDLSNLKNLDNIEMVGTNISTDGVNISNENGQDINITMANVLTDSNGEGVSITANNVNAELFQTELNGLTLNAASGETEHNLTITDSVVDNLKAEGADVAINASGSDFDAIEFGASENVALATDNYTGIGAIDAADAEYATLDLRGAEPNNESGLPIQINDNEGTEVVHETRNPDALYTKLNEDLGDVVGPTDLPVSPTLKTGQDDIDLAMREYTAIDADGNQSLDLKKMSKNSPALYEKVLKTGINYNEASVLKIKMDGSEDILPVNLGENATDVVCKDANIAVSTPNEVLNIAGDDYSSIDNIDGENLRILNVDGYGMNIKTDLSNLNELEEVKLNNADISTKGVSIYNPDNNIDVEMNGTRTLLNSEGVNLIAPNINATMNGSEINILNTISTAFDEGGSANNNVNVYNSYVDALNVEGEYVKVDAATSDIKAIDFQESESAELITSDFTQLVSIDATSTGSAGIDLSGAEPFNGKRNPIQVLKNEDVTIMHNSKKPEKLYEEHIMDLREGPVATSDGDSNEG